MKYTSNYLLRKPDTTDIVDIADFNTNVDKIDTEIKKVNDLVSSTDTKIDTKVSEITSQLEQNKKELTDKINEVATTGTTTEVLQATTQTYIQEKISDGTIANLTIGENSITNTKYKNNSITLDKCKFIDKSINLFNKNSENVKLHHFCDQYGNIVELTNYYCSDKIYVSPGTKITFRYAEANMGGCFDIDGKFLNRIGTNGGTASPFTFTVPTNCSYVIINGKVSNINTDMIVIGESYPQTYIPFTGNKIDKNLIKDIPSSSLADLTPNIAYNKYLELNKFAEEGYEIKEKEGCYIYKIPISELKDISINKLTYSVAVKTNAYRSHRFYDSELNYISDSGYTPNVSTITISSIPSNAYYLVINGQEEVIKHYLFNINYGDTLKSFNFPGLNNYLFSSYTEYLVDKFIQENNSIISKISGNPLYGKTIIFDGDSICQGDVNGGWAKRIADNNSMLYTNYGRNGGTITAEITGDRHWICRNVVNYRNDADYIILEGGTNDADLLKEDESKIGVISNGYDAELDDKTFCGALESLLKQTIIKFNGKKIGFIIAQKMGTHAETLERRRKYFDLVAKICEKWGVPYIDLWKTSYLNPNIETSSINYFDGQHPTPLGYDIISSQIENWIKTL